MKQEWGSCLSTNMSSVLVNRVSVRCPSLGMEKTGSRRCRETPGVNQVVLLEFLFSYMLLIFFSVYLLALIVKPMGKQRLDSCPQRRRPTDYFFSPVELAPREL